MARAFLTMDDYSCRNAVQATKEMGSKGDRNSLEKMMAQLIKDCRTRGEIALKCAQCEEEIIAERKRRETREREMNLQMDAMQVYYGETDESG